MEVTDSVRLFSVWSMTEPTENYDADPVGFPTVSDEENVRGRLPVELLSAQFVDELRSGQEPSIDEYAKLYPRVAADIREYFPVLVAMEELKQKKQTDNLRDSVPEQFNITELGRCRMLREIGRGGMGVVFEAVEDTGRQVAVKLLPWHTAGIPGWRERFTREAKNARKMRHPNIVPIYRTGSDKRYCYYVMRLVSGVGLDWVIAKLATDHLVEPRAIRAASHRPRTVTEIDTDCEIPIQLLGELEDVAAVTTPETQPLTLFDWYAAVKIMLQAAQAVDYAHKRGVLHNDVKPANLLIDDTWKVWMTDFGLAQPLDSPQSDDERLVGTLRYMAPERIRGGQTVQTDVYSLGMTMYELICQTPGFPATDRDDLVELILQQEPPAPRDINYSIPDALQTIILNAITPDPELRYATARELELDLVRYLNRQPVESRRKTPAKKFNFFKKRT